ncbi:glycosyltransferase [Roseovarius nanhaiticus]|uniref:glycosyltransferase n=1 Tax=Roseovarius nanhaiticus TaxID=573024 RepID=UPI0024933E7F|nr:glycosyltransferase [Roseovarius nanhaiticus]
MKAFRQETARAPVAIVDPCSAAGYDLPDLGTGGLGGTEATVLRVAAALGSRFEITQYQQGRGHWHMSEAGTLRPLQDLDNAQNPAALIVINRWKVAIKLRKWHPDTPIFLWLHVYPGRHNRRMGAALKAADITVICVSNTHARELAGFLGAEDVPPIRVIYDPLDDDLHPDATPRDPDRLLFASSPHKGLAEVFEQFAALRRDLPNLTLAVGDPGYLRWDTGPVPEGVVFLGSLSHGALVRQMRRALCLFYPQTTFAETFGLVLAEANAVGTPVLVHDGLGANAEIVADATQRVDGHDPAQILGRIRAWRRAPPQVTANPAFRLGRVTEDWVQLLEHAAARHPEMEMVKST